MRSFSHWTPQYIVDRLAHWWFQRRNPDSPWLTQTAVDMLASWLKPTDIGFEWGCGRSTLWFSLRVKHITSVEHDSSWHARVQGQLRERQIINVELLHRELAGDLESAYVHAIDACRDESLDFALVDGRLREHCMAVAIPKLRRGGLLVLDNANLYLPCESRAPGSRRKEAAPGWEGLARKISPWRTIWTTSGISDTAFFFKPIETPHGIPASPSETP